MGSQRDADASLGGGLAIQKVIVIYVTYIVIWTKTSNCSCAHVSPKGGVNRNRYLETDKGKFGPKGMNVGTLMSYLDGSNTNPRHA